MASGEDQVDQGAAASLLVVLVHVGMGEGLGRQLGKAMASALLTKIRNGPTIKNTINGYF